MSNIQVFNHQIFGELPVMIVDGVEWFGATEAASALSFSRPHDAIKNHVEEEDSAVHVVLTNGGKQNNTFGKQRAKSAIGKIRNMNLKEMIDNDRWRNADVYEAFQKHFIF